MIFQILLDFRNIYVTKDTAQVEFCANLSTVKYIRMYKGVSVKSKLQHSGIWSASTWPTNRMCYRRTVLFCHLVIALLFVQGKFRGTF